MMLVVEEINDGQNSHSRNLPQSFLGRWVNNWYVVHKFIHIIMPLWYSWLSTHLWCGCAKLLRSSVQFCLSAFF